MRILIEIFTIVLVFITIHSAVLAQDTLTCQVVKSYPNGSYLVTINGKDYFAITEDMERRMLKQRRDLLDAQKEIALKDSLLVNYEQTKAWYDTTISRMRDYITELESTYEGYKNLYQDYKKLKEPWLTFEAGLGATSKKTKPAILMGFRIHALHVWGLLQENNLGAMIGTDFRLFR